MTVFILSWRDGIFAKDGRGWYTSASGRAHGLPWPFPSTLLGALRTAWGRSQENADNKLFTPQDWTKATNLHLGRTVVVRAPIAQNGQPGVEHRVWPVPCDALFLDNEKPEPDVIHLDPKAPRLTTMGSDDDDAREALWVPVVERPGKPKAPPAWWSEGAFIEWLKSSEAQGAASRTGFAPERRFQMHVGISAATQTAEDSLLYGYEILETLDVLPGKDTPHEWRIACEATPWDDPPARMAATFGGDRRPMSLEKSDDKLFACPKELAEAFDEMKPKGLRLVVTTPMASDKGWLPEEFERVSAGDKEKYVANTLPGLSTPVELLAALVGRPRHVSGWDMATQRPKPTTRLIPPGSVYHVVKQNRESFTAAEAQALWLQAMGAKTEEGFGRIVPGLWIPKGNLP